MSDLETVLMIDTPSVPEAVAPSLLDATQPEKTGIPYDIPEKFWNAELGEVRTEQLAKSYLELERRLGREPLPGQGEENAPLSSVDDYDIKVSGETFSVDPEINKQLFDAGFSQDQAQMVYDLAEQHLTPMVTELAASLESQKQIERLNQQFGGSDKWQTVSAQIKSWGKSHFPADVYTALSSSYEGVLAMHKMMGSNDEPALLGGGAAQGQPMSEDALKELMRDPGYWRDKNPSILAQVEQGFKLLYPDTR